MKALVISHKLSRLLELLQQTQTTNIIISIVIKFIKYIINNWNSAPSNVSNTFTL